MVFIAEDAEEVTNLLELPTVREILEDPKCFLSAVTPTGELLIVSKGVENIMGYTPSEMVHLNGMAHLMHPDDKEVADTAYHGLREGPIELICRGLCKNGEYAWFSNRLMMVDGLITAVVAPTAEVMEGAVWAPTPPFI